MRRICRQDVLDALSVALQSSNGEWLGWGKDVGRAIGEIEDGCGNMGDNSGDDYDRLELVMGWSVSHEVAQLQHLKRWDSGIPCLLVLSIFNSYRRKFRSLTSDNMDS